MTAPPGTGVIPFTDPVSRRECSLSIPPAGPVTVGHPGCATGADLVVELDAFFCPSCKFGGRVSGAWAMEAIGKARGAGS